MSFLPNICGEFTVVKEPEMRFMTTGKAKLKLRCAAKDRKYKDGAWVDGTSLYIDVVVWQQAEYLMESITKGDAIVVTGVLKADEWTDKDGNQRSTTFIEATNIGPSVRWGIAKSAKAGGNGAGGVASVAAALGATDITPQEDVAPF